MMHGNGHLGCARDRGRSVGLGHRRAAVSPLAAVVSVAVSPLLAVALLAASADPGAPDSTAPIASAARFAVSQPAALISAHFSVLASVLPVAWPTAVPAFAVFLVFQPASAPAAGVFSCSCCGYAVPASMSESAAVPMMYLSFIATSTCQSRRCTYATNRLRHGINNMQTRETRTVRVISP
jgi:hypothetical protein